MKKRLKFRCWNCKKVYSIYREVDLEQKMIVGCPFCDAEAVVDFTPEEPTDVLRNMSIHERSSDVVGRLPEILPTKKRA